jgi:short subunit dehydrogenase-like uncharacterized protein
MPRDHDVVVFGATGFVGKLTAAYLAGAAPAGTKLALGGRSREKLERVRDGLGLDWPVVVADSSDAAQLREVAESTTAVATTVGPYLKYGMPMVQACAEAGTHYADLTGEVLFVRKAIDQWHAKAQETGAKVVNACGFDSIPSDIALLLLHEAAGEPLDDATLVVKGFSGGFSGGTIESIRGIVDEAKRDKASRKVVFDPFSLTPDRSKEADPSRHGDPTGITRDAELGGYLAPFMMGTYNARIVRRSNALLDHAYGRDVRYRELQLGGKGPAGAAKAAAVTGGLGVLLGGFALWPTRKLLDRVLPDPGEGPSEQARENGFFAIDVHAETISGRKLVCRVRASGDPGYKATAVMLGEASLALALDQDQLPDRAGVLTPATAMGDVLVSRLRRAGHTYEVSDRSETR